MTVRWHLLTLGLTAASGLLLQPQKASAQDHLSGLYIGVFGGWALLEADIQTPATRVTMQPANSRPVTLTVPAQRMERSGNGSVAGIQIGYGLLVSDKIYLGVETDFSAPFRATLKTNYFNSLLRGSLDHEFAFYVRGGWTPDGQTMFYARAGLAIPRQSIEVGTASVQRWTPTPAIGLGVEYAPVPYFSVRGDVTSYPALEVNQIGSWRLVLGVAYRF